MLCTTRNRSKAFKNVHSTKKKFIFTTLIELYEIPGLITVYSSSTYTSFLKIKKVLGLVVFSLDNLILFIFMVTLISEVLLGLCHIFLIQDCAPELLCFVHSFPGKKHSVSHHQVL